MLFWWKRWVKKSYQYVKVMTRSESYFGEKGREEGDILDNFKICLNGRHE